LKAGDNVRKVRAVTDADLLTIRDLVAAAGISRQAVQTRLRRQGIPTSKVIRNGRSCILVRRVDADAAGLTRQPTADADAGAVTADSGIAAAFAEERAKVEHLSQEVGRLAAELIAKDELRDQGDWLRKATERRCDKLEQKIEDRDREIDDLRRTALHRDSEVAQLRQDIAVLTSRHAVPLLASSPHDRRGWLARLLFGR
jgi:hypothetical protein